MKKWRALLSLILLLPLAGVAQSLSINSISSVPTPDSRSLLQFAVTQIPESQIPESQIPESWVMATERSPGRVGWSYPSGATYAVCVANSPSCGWVANTVASTVASTVTGLSQPPVQAPTRVHKHPTTRDLDSGVLSQESPSLAPASYVAAAEAISMDGPSTQEARILAALSKLGYRTYDTPLVGDYLQDQAAKAGPNIRWSGARCGGRTSTRPAAPASGSPAPVPRQWFLRERAICAPRARARISRSQGLARGGA